MRRLSSRKHTQLGPLDEVPEETAMDATYDDWLLAEARVALRTAREVERLREQSDAVTCGWKTAYKDVVRALEVGE